jgi:hypothetical protein
MNVLNDFVAGLQFGDTQQYGRLTIRPVIAEGDFALPFLTLEEAFAKDAIEITETHESGSVPELLVKNKGDIDVILIEGETLAGAKQNRMVNTTTIVPAKSEIVLPVTCVERGRWSYKSRKFSAGGHVAYQSMRRSSHRAVSASLAMCDRADSDQSEVWTDINAKLGRLNIESETEASIDIAEGVMRSVAYAEPEPMEEKIRHLERQVGFLAFIDGGFAGGDLFGSSELCAKQLEKLARGYLIDSEDRGISFPKVGEDDVLKGIAEADLVERASIGKGREMRFGSELVEGACKLVDDRVSHVTVFPK